MCTSGPKAAINSVAYPPLVPVNETRLDCKVSQFFNQNFTLRPIAKNGGPWPPFREYAV